MAKMTPDEVRAFLLAEPARTAKVATVRVDGRPHVAPVWFALEGETLLFTTWHETVKAANLARDPRIAIAVDDEEPPFAFVLIEGEVEIEKEAPDLLYWTTRIARRYMGEELAEEYGHRNGVPGEWLIRVRMEKVVAEKDVAGEAGE